MGICGEVISDPEDDAMKVPFTAASKFGKTQRQTGRSLFQFQRKNTKEC